MIKTIAKYKYFLLLFVIAVILAVLYVNGKKSVHHEIYINASTENVWSILMDTESYESWNPVLKVISGELEKGKSIVYEFKQDDDISEIKATVEEVVPAKLLNQTGGTPIVFSFDHKYILEKDVIGTKFTIHVDYRGIGVNWWSPTSVAIAYSKLASALEQRAES